MNPSSSNSESGAKKESTAVDMNGANPNANSPKADEERPFWCTTLGEGILVGSLFAALFIFITLLALYGAGLFDKPIKPTIAPVTDEPSPVTDIPTTTPAPIVVDIPTFNVSIELNKTAYITCASAVDSIDIVSANWTADASPINCAFDVLQSIASDCLKQSITPKEGRKKEDGCQLTPDHSSLREVWNDTCLESQKNSSWTLRVVHRCINFGNLKNKNEYLSKEISRERGMILDCGPQLVDVISATWSVPDGDINCIRDVTSMVKEVCIEQDDGPTDLDIFPSRKDAIFNGNEDKRCVVRPAASWLEKTIKGLKWPMPLMCKDFHKKLKVDYKCISDRKEGSSRTAMGINMITGAKADTIYLMCTNSNSYPVKILKATWYVPGLMQCRINATLAVAQECREQYKYPKDVLKKDVCEVSPDHVWLFNCKDKLSTDDHCEPKAGFDNCPFKTSVWQVRIIYTCKSDITP